MACDCNDGNFVAFTSHHYQCHATIADLFQPTYLLTYCLASSFYSTLLTMTAETQRYERRHKNKKKHLMKLSYHKTTGNTPIISGGAFLY